MAQKKAPAKSPLRDWLSRNPDRALAISLFLLAFLVFANTFSHDYAWDDKIVITENSRTQAGFAGIPSQWQEHDRVRLEDFSGYRPVTLTSFNIDIGIFGPKPGPAHLMNVVYFGLLCMVIYFTLRRLFPNHHRYFAFLVTLLFLVHPIHTEVVANIKSRDEIFAMLFGMLSLHAFLQYLSLDKWKWLGMSFAFLILATLSRQNGLFFIATYPIAAFLLPQTGRRGKIIGMLMPLMSLCLVVGVYWALTQRLPTQASPVNPEGYLETLELGNSFAATTNIWQKIGSATRLIILYLKDFCFPANLRYYTGYNVIPFLDWNHRILAVPFVTVLLGLGYGILQWIRGKQRELSWAILWTLLFLTPYLHLLFALADTKADRFLFISSLGLSGLVVALIGKAWKVKWEGLIPSPQNNRQSILSQPLGKVFLSIASISVLLAGITLNRNTAWKNNLTLFSTDMPKLENCARCHYFLGQEMLAQLGEYPQGPKHEEALVHLKRAIAITDSAYYAYTDLANQLIRVNRFAEAETYMQKAVQFYPNQEDPWYYLGKAQFFQNKFADAAQSFQQARMLNPKQDENWELEGRALERSQQFKAAQDRISEAIRLFPQNPALRDALVDAYFYGGDTTVALQQMNQLVAMDPGNTFWWKKRIGLYEAAQMTDSAAYYFQQAQLAGKL